MNELRVFASLPPAPRQGRAWAGIVVRVAATLMLVVGLALVAGVACLVLWAALQPGLAVRVNVRTGSTLGLLGGLALLASACVVASRRKRVVLFLRRFGHASANQALSGAMYRSLGGVARLVVLDDSVFRPIAIPFRQRLMILLSVLPAAVALVSVLTLGAAISGPVVLQGAGIRVEQDGFINIGPAAPDSTDQTAYTGLPALLQLPQAPLLWAALAALGWLTWRGVAAGWESRRRVDEDSDLQGLLRRMTWLARRVAAPKPLGSVATVVSSSDSMWQQVVAALASRASLIVLDVSFPTAPILWELQHCLEHHRDRLLLVLNEDEHWRTAGLAVDEPALVALVARTPLGGILAYAAGDAARRKAFEADLRAMVGRADAPP